MASCEELGLHWTESGRADAAAPVVVLSNALGCTLDMWDPQLDLLEADYRVIRYDQRGHGGSRRPPGPYLLEDLAFDVLALVDHLGVRKFSFIGAALGGMIGLWLAAHEPERVERLTVCCTTACLHHRDAELERAEAAREHGTSELVSPTIERWFTPYFREHHGAETAGYAAMMASTDDEAYALCSEAIAHADLRSDLSAISVPTLVIAGADDPVTPPEHAEEIVAGIGSNARLEVLAHVAHLANVESAEDFNALLEL
ncbi:3-oxoadipate enol-lactonase [Parasphingorhabdus pacifica]